jgi:hypothetical protein
MTVPQLTPKDEQSIQNRESSKFTLRNGLRMHSIQFLKMTQSFTILCNPQILTLNLTFNIRQTSFAQQNMLALGKRIASLRQILEKNTK